MKTALGDSCACISRARLTSCAAHDTSSIDRLQRKHLADVSGHRETFRRRLNERDEFITRAALGEAPVCRKMRRRGGPTTRTNQIVSLQLFPPKCAANGSQCYCPGARGILRRPALTWNTIDVTSVTHNLDRLLLPRTGS